MTKTLATLATTTALLAFGAPAASALAPVTQSATSVSDNSAVLRGKVTPAGVSLHVYFVYGKTTSYGSQTVAGSVLSTDTVAVTSKVGNLEPNTTYHYRFVAQGLLTTDYGDDVAFTTAADHSGTSGSSGADSSGSVVSTNTGDGDSQGEDQNGDGPGDGSPILSVVPPALGGSGDGVPAAKPELGQKLVAGASSGSVGVKTPGSSNFATLAGNAAVRVGSIVDARHGTVRLVTALTGGATQTGTFRGAIFQVKQSRAGGGMTDIVLRGGNFAACKSGSQQALASRVSAAGRARVVRRLWGNDHHGRFRTRGSNSIATVRGTSWVTTDRCDGTQTSVSKGSVSVRDLRRKKSVLVRAGHSYLARGRH